VISTYGVFEIPENQDLSTLESAPKTPILDPPRIPPRNIPTE